MPIKYNLILIILFVLCLIPMQLQGQKKTTLFEVTVINAETKEVLIGATALNLKTGKGEVTNNQGILYIKKENSEDVIEFSYLGFIKKQFKLKTVPSRIFLQKNANILDNITILSERIPQALTLKDESITDFVMAEDKIITLSKRAGKKYVLNLTDLDGQVISTNEIPPIKHVEALFTSCFGTYFLLGKNEVLQLHISNNKIAIIDREKRNLFDRYIKPCQTQNDEYIYFEKRTLKEQIASIYGFSKKGEETFLFAGVSDDENIKRYKYDAPYMNYADGTGPLYLGIHAQDERDAMQWGDMLNMHFYLPVDYFVMSHQDKVLLFDHEKFKLRTYDKKGNLIKQNPIEYPKQKGWRSKDNLYVDSITNKLYAVHRIANRIYFTEIDLETGASKQQYLVKEPFIENIAIHNGIIYFTNSSIVQSSRLLKKIKL